MKKILISTIALAAASASLAQSSVTLSGVVDASLTMGRGSVANKTQLANSANSSSRIVFRGTEDLGGGLSAGFFLDAGVANDDGTGFASSANNQNPGAFDATTGANAPVRSGTQGLTFNRRSTVSLIGNFGELRLGRDFTSHFLNHGYDVFGVLGVGTTLTISPGISQAGNFTAVRASNMLGYFLPRNLGGFGGQIQYYLGENASSTGSSDGNGFSLRATYDAGPVSAAVSYGKTKYAAGDVTTTNAGGSYNFGAAKLYGIYDQDKNGAVTGKGFNLGVTAPVGAGEIKASYSSYKTDAAGTPKANKLAVGYVHNMSKRTALYATVARLSNSGGAKQSLGGSTTAANGSSTGYDFGLRHSF